MPNPDRKIRDKESGSVKTESELKATGVTDEDIQQWLTDGTVEDVSEPEPVAAPKKKTVSSDNSGLSGVMVSPKDDISGSPSVGSDTLATKEVPLAPTSLWQSTKKGISEFKDFVGSFFDSDQGDKIKPAPALTPEQIAARKEKMAQYGAPGAGMNGAKPLGGPGSGMKAEAEGLDPQGPDVADPLVAGSSQVQQPYAGAGTALAKIKAEIAQRKAMTDKDYDKRIADLSKKAVASMMAQKEAYLPVNRPATAKKEEPDEKYTTLNEKALDMLLYGMTDDAGNPLTARERQEVHNKVVLGVGHARTGYDFQQQTKAQYAIGTDDLPDFNKSAWDRELAWLSKPANMRGPKPVAPIHLNGGPAGTETPADKIYTASDPMEQAKKAALAAGGQDNALAAGDKDFQDWYHKNTLEGKRNVPYSDKLDYDYYSFYKSQAKGNIEDHFPDTYKRPNHETFSNESIYSTPDNPGGTWKGEEFIPSPVKGKIYEPAFKGNKQHLYTKFGENANDPASQITDPQTLVDQNLKEAYTPTETAKVLVTQMLDDKERELVKNVQGGTLTEKAANDEYQKYRISVMGTLEEAARQKALRLNKEAGIPMVYQGEIDTLESQMAELEKSAGTGLAKTLPKYKLMAARLEKLKGFQQTGEYSPDDDPWWAIAQNKAARVEMVRENEKVKEVFNNMGMWGGKMAPDAHLRGLRNFSGKQVQGLLMGVGNIEAMAGAALNFMGAYGAGNYVTKRGQDFAKANEVPLALDAAGNPVVIDDEIGTWVARNMSAQIPLVASLGGAAHLTGGAAVAFLEGAGVMAKMSPFIRGAMGGFITAPAESYMEGMDRYNQSISQGKSLAEAEADAKKVFYENTLMTVFTNPLEYGLMAMPYAGKAAAIMHHSAEAALNGSQEVVQEWIQARRDNPALGLWQYAQSVDGQTTFLSGAAMGTMQSVAMGTYQNWRIKKATDNLFDFDNYTRPDGSITFLPPNHVIAKAVRNAFNMSDSPNRLRQLHTLIDNLESTGAYTAQEATRVKGIIDDVHAVKDQVPAFGTDEQQAAVFGELMEIRTRNKLAKTGAGTKVVSDMLSAQNTESEARIKRIMTQKEPLYFVNGNETHKEQFLKTIDEMVEDGILTSPNVRLSVTNDPATEKHLADQVASAKAKEAAANTPEALARTSALKEAARTGAHTTPPPAASTVVPPAGTTPAGTTTTTVPVVSPIVVSPVGTETKTERAGETKTETKEEPVILSARDVVLQDKKDLDSEHVEIALEKIAGNDISPYKKEAQTAATAYEEELKALIKESGLSDQDLKDLVSHGGGMHAAAVLKGLLKDAVETKTEPVEEAKTEPVEETKTEPVKETKKQAYSTPDDEVTMFGKPEQLLGESVATISEDHEEKMDRADYDDHFARYADQVQKMLQSKFEKAGLDPDEVTEDTRDRFMSEIYDPASAALNEGKTMGDVLDKFMEGFTKKDTKAKADQEAKEKTEKETKEADDKTEQEKTKVPPFQHTLKAAFVDKHGIAPGFSQKNFDDLWYKGVLSNSNDIGLDEVAPDLIGDALVNPDKYIEAYQKVNDKYGKSKGKINTEDTEGAKKYFLELIKPAKQTEETEPKTEPKTETKEDTKTEPKKITPLTSLKGATNKNQEALLLERLNRAPGEFGGTEEMEGKKKGQKKGVRFYFYDDESGAEIKIFVEGDPETMAEAIETYMDSIEDQLPKKKPFPEEEEDNPAAGDDFDYSTIQNTETYNNEDMWGNPTRVTAEQTAREAPVMTLAEAKRTVDGWEDTAWEMGKTEDNSKKVVISLFDRSGVWTEGFHAAGYITIHIDVQHDSGPIDYYNLMEALGTGERRFKISGDIAKDFPMNILELKRAMIDSGLEVVGVLSATPCTTFAGSGAQHWGMHDTSDFDEVNKRYGWWAAKHWDSPSDYNQGLVMITSEWVQQLAPTRFHVMENPVGRIKDVMDLPQEAMTFHPNLYGDPYTKKTLLWGKFNTALPTAHVEASQGSKIQSKLGSKNKNERSETPRGFAYAFFMANSDQAAKATETDDQARERVREAIQALRGKRFQDPATEAVYEVVSSLDGDVMLKGETGGPRKVTYEEFKTFTEVKDETKTETKTEPKTETKTAPKKSKIIPDDIDPALLEELKAKQAAFLKAFRDANTTNINFDPIKAAKFLATGIDLLGTYTKIGIIEFRKIVMNSIEAFGREVMNSDMIEGLRSAYVSHRARQSREERAKYNTDDDLEDFITGELPGLLKEEETTEVEALDYSKMSNKQKSMHHQFMFQGEKMNGDTVSANEHHDKWTEFNTPENRISEKEMQEYHTNYVWDDTAEDTDTMVKNYATKYKDLHKEQKASVPLMITKKMEADLKAKGYTQEAIDKMTPQQAHDFLGTPISGEDYRKIAAQVNAGGSIADDTQDYSEGFPTGVKSDYGVKNLPALKKLQWALWMRDRVQKQLANLRGTDPTRFVKWATDNARTLKAQGVRDLLEQRRALEEYMSKQLTRHYDTTTNAWVSYSEAEIRKVIEQGIIPTQARERMLEEYRNKLGIKEQEEAPVYKALKVGDSIKSFDGKTYEVVEVETVDGVEFSLSQGPTGTNAKGLIRVTDVDTGKMVGLTSYPTFKSGQDKFSELVTLAKKGGEDYLTDHAEQKKAAERRAALEAIGAAFTKRFGTKSKVISQDEARRILEQDESREFFFQILDEIDLFNDMDQAKAEAFIKKVFQTVKDADEAKRAYRKLANKYHPDKNPGATAVEIFKYLNNRNEDYKNGRTSSGNQAYDDFMRQHEAFMREHARRQAAQQQAEADARAAEAERLRKEKERVDAEAARLAKLAIEHEARRQFEKDFPKPSVGKKSWWQKKSDKTQSELDAEHEAKFQDLKADYIQRVEQDEARRKAEEFARFQRAAAEKARADAEAQTNMYARLKAREARDKAVLAATAARNQAFADSITRKAAAQGAATAARDAARAAAARGDRTAYIKADADYIDAIRKNEAEYASTNSKINDTFNKALAAAFDAYNSKYAYQKTGTSELPAGFYDESTGTAYIVDGIADDTTPIHELFSHPFIAAIEKSNPVLYQNLLAAAKADKGISDYVSEQYAGASQRTLDHEHITRAIDLEARGQLKDKSLIDHIREFWKAVTGLIHSMFDQGKGKASTGTIKATTTVKELVHFVLSTGYTLDLHTAADKVDEALHAIGGAFKKRFGTNYKVITEAEAAEILAQQQAKEYFFHIIDEINLFTDTDTERAKAFIKHVFETIGQAQGGSWTKDNIVVPQGTRGAEYMSEDAKKAYRKLAVKYHPDKGAAHEIMAELNRANEIYKKGGFLPGGTGMGGKSKFAQEQADKKEKRYKSIVKRYEARKEADRRARMTQAQRDAEDKAAADAKKSNTAAGRKKKAAEDKKAAEKRAAEQLAAEKKKAAEDKAYADKLQAERDREAYEAFVKLYGDPKAKKDQTNAEATERRNTIKKQAEEVLQAERTTSQQEHDRAIQALETAHDQALERAKKARNLSEATLGKGDFAAQKRVRDTFYATMHEADGDFITSRVAAEQEFAARTAETLARWKKTTDEADAAFAKEFQFQRTEDGKMPPGFYDERTNTAYLVRGVATDTTAIHELFSHPFIIAIEKNNKPLYDQLLTSVKRDRAIVDFVRTHYPNVSERTFDHELITRAIDLEAKGKLEDKTLLDHIRDFWKAVTDMFRSMFGPTGGKATLESLHAHTPLRDLVDFVLESGESLPLVVKPKLKETDKDTLSLKGFYDTSNSTASDVHETGNRAPERKFKADLDGFARALSLKLGWEFDVYKKGSKNPGRKIFPQTSVAPAGGEGSIKLFAPGFNYGVSITVRVRRQGENLQAEQGVALQAITRDGRALAEGKFFEQVPLATMTVGTVADKINALEIPADNSNFTNENQPNDGKKHSGPISDPLRDGKAGMDGGQSGGAADGTGPGGNAEGGAGRGSGQGDGSVPGSDQSGTKRGGGGRGGNGGYTGTGGAGRGGTQTGNEQQDTGRDQSSADGQHEDRRAPDDPNERNHVIEDSDVLVPEGAIARAVGNMDAIILVKALETENRNATPAEKKILARFVGWGGVSGYLNTKKTYEKFGGPNHVAAKILMGILKGGETWFNAKHKITFPGLTITGRSFDDIAKTLQQEYAATLKDKAGLADFLDMNVFDEKRVLSLDEARRLVIGHIFTEAEMQAAEVSTKNAHYTERGVIKAMWALARHLGFKGGNFLESSAGVGHFRGLQPADLAAKTFMTAVELDSFSGRILQKLYPEDVIMNKGFEHVHIANNSQDLVMTNVPFAEKGYIFDATNPDISKFNLHNYFIAKNLRLLKPGGIAILITSRSTMDAPISGRARRWFASAEGGNSEFIGAVRLPNNAFSGNAGTQVTTDIMVFQKRKDSTVKNVNPFASTVNVRSVMVDVESKNAKGETIVTPTLVEMHVNEYYIKNPTHMVGEMKFAFEVGAGGLYGNTDATLHPKDGVNTHQRVKEIFETFPRDILDSEPSEKKKGPTVRSYEREGRMILVDGVPYQAKGETAEPVVFQWKFQEQVARDYVPLRDKFIELIQAEQSTEATEQEIEKLRADLNKLYDAFVSTHRAGAQSDKNRDLGSIMYHRFLDALDADYPLAEAMEEGGKKSVFSDRLGKIVKKWDVRKAPVMRQRVNFPRTEPTSADSYEDAINISLGHRNVVDETYIGRLMGVSPQAARAQMLDDELVFENPANGLLETPEDYLSGNVRIKLELARNAAEANPRLLRNVEALKAALPKDEPPSAINFRAGVHWLPIPLYQQFIEETFGVEALITYVAQGNQWRAIPHGGVDDSRNITTFGVRADARIEPGGDAKTGFEIFADLLNSRPSTIQQARKGEGGSISWYTAPIATAAAEAMQNRLNDMFVRFVKAKHSDIMVEKFNEFMNAEVPLKTRMPNFEYFPGAARVWKLRLHQVKGVMRALRQNVLFAHSVGTGKTLTMITTGEEMKRLRLASKVMIVVRNSTVQDFVKKYRALYPGANLIVTDKEDMSAHNRKRFFARIATAGNATVIIAHSQIDQIPDDPERVEQYIQEQIAEMQAVLDNMDDNTPRHVKYQMEQAMSDLQKEVDTLYQDDVKTDASGKIMRDAAGNPIMMTSDTERAEQAAREKARIEAEGEAYWKAQGSPSKGKNDVKKRGEAIAKARARILKQVHRRTDNTMFFHELGIDALLIDESHEYKKLGFRTGWQGVKGIDVGSSKKAISTLMKIRSVKDRTGGKNIVFATGTPITNTMAEAWTNLRFVNPELLERMGITYFDQFVKNFAEVRPSLEQNAGGQFENFARLAHFFNARSFIKAFRTIADVVTPKDIPEFDQDPNNAPPKLAGGGITPVILPMAGRTRSMLKRVSDMFDVYKAMSGKEKQENSALPLMLYTIGKNAAIDLRLIDPHAPDDPGSKANKTVEKAMELYHQYDKYKATQMIFADNFQGSISENVRRLANVQPGGVRFNLFEDIRQKLIAKGVPPHEIAIANDKKYMDKDGTAYEALQQDVRDGVVRFLIGTTARMGVGVNVQDRMIALHHIDVPIRPDLFTQRNGRIWRQGNGFNNREFTGGDTMPVHIFTYGMEDTRDATAFLWLSKKEGIINQAMAGQVSEDNIMADDAAEEDKIDFLNQMSANLSGSRSAKELAQVNTDLRAEQARFNFFGDKQRETQQQLKYKLVEAGHADIHIAWAKKIEEVIKARFPNDGASMFHTLEMNGVTYTEKLGDPINAAIAHSKTWLVENKEKKEAPTISFKVNGVPMTITLHTAARNTYTAKMVVADLGEQGRTLGTESAASFYSLLRSLVATQRDVAGRAMRERDQTIKDIATLREDLKQTFDETRLNELQERVRQLNIEVLRESAEMKEKQREAKAEYERMAKEYTDRGETPPRPPDADDDYYGSHNANFREREDDDDTAFNSFYKAKMHEPVVPPTEAELKAEAALPRNRLQEYRGAAKVIEALEAGVKDGVISREAADLGIMMMRRRPTLFKNLGLVAPGINNTGIGASYFPLSEWIQIFKNGGDPMVALHEILHHTERFLPDRVRNAIRKEWQAATAARIADLHHQLAKENQIDEEKAFAQTMLHYFELAQQLDKETHKRARYDIEVAMQNALFDIEDQLQYFDADMTLMDVYSHSTPSEWWAVNASRMFKEKDAAERVRSGDQGWVEQAKAYYREFLKYIKELLGITHKSEIDAVEKGLEAILRGKETPGSRFNNTLKAQISMDDALHTFTPGGPGSGAAGGGTTPPPGGGGAAAAAAAGGGPPLTMAQKIAQERADAWDEYVAAKKIADTRFFGSEDFDERRAAQRSRMQKRNILNRLQDKYWKPGFDYLSDQGRKLTEAAMVSDHKRMGALLRTLSKAVNAVLANMGKTREDMRRSERMIGEARERSHADINRIDQVLREMVKGDPKSLERIHQVLDPDFFKERTFAEWSKLLEDELGALKFAKVKLADIQASYVSYRAKFGFDEPGYKMHTQADLSLDENEAYEQVRFLYDMIHKLNFAIGKIGYNTFLQNKGVYAARLYDYYEVPKAVRETLYGTMSKAEARAEEDLYKKRGETTQWKLMHGVTDPLYSMGKRVQQTMANKAIYDYADYLVANKPKAFSPTERKGFQKMGSTGFGALNGKFVRDDIAEDFLGYHYTNVQMQKVYDVFKAYDKIPLRRWQKQVYTVGNPGVQLGNMLSNVVFAHLMGINPARFGRDLFWARKQKDLYSAEYRYLLSEGVLGTDLVRADMQQRAGLAKPKKINLFQRKIADPLNRFYSNVDNVAKIAAFKSLTDLGYSPKEAVEQIKEGFQNYKRVGKMYMLFSKVPFIGPAFGRFAGDLARIIKKSMTERPLQTIMFMSALQTLSLLTSLWAGESDDDRRIRESRAGWPHIPWFKFLGGNVSLEFMYKWDGDMMRVNLARLLSPIYLYSNPSGDETWEFWQKLSPMPVEWTTQTKNPGGPGIASIGMNLNDPTLGPLAQLFPWINADFRGMPIWDPAVTKYLQSKLEWQDRFINAMRFLFRAYVPYGPLLEDSISSALGKANALGKVQKPWQVMTSLFGVKIDEFPPTKYGTIMEGKMNSYAWQWQEEQKVIQAITKDLIAGKISEEKFFKQSLPHVNAQIEIAKKGQAEFTKLTGRLGSLDFRKDRPIADLDKREAEGGEDQGEGNWEQDNFQPEFVPSPQ